VTNEHLAVIHPHTVSRYYLIIALRNVDIVRKKAEISEESLGLTALASGVLLCALSRIPTRTSRIILGVGYDLFAGVCSSIEVEYMPLGI
jgi:hypothetical protein